MISWCYYIVLWSLIKDRNKLVFLILLFVRHNRFYSSCHPREPTRHTVLQSRFSVLGLSVKEARILVLDKDVHSNPTVEQIAP